MVYEIILLIYLSEIDALNFYKEQFINIRFESGLVKLNQLRALLLFVALG